MSKGPFHNVLDRDDLDQEFAYATSTWKDDNVARAAGNLIALEEGKHQQRLEAMAAGVTARVLLSQVPVPEISELPLFGFQYPGERGDRPPRRLRLYGDLI
jgi:hypothetical protein